MRHFNDQLSVRRFDARARTQWRLRGAFTLVELLVVIGIVGALMSLLFPAVQASREASRRIKCQSNMRQLAQAVLLYEEQHRALPPSGIVAPTAASNGYGLYEARSGKMISWVVQILPNLESQTLRAQFDMNRSILEQPNEPQARRLPIMECPSDGVSGAVFRHAELTKGKTFAKGNYAAYVSPFHVEYQNFYPGALIAHRVQRLTKFTDGVTRTLLLSEVRTSAREGDQRGAWALPWTGASLLAFDAHPDLSAAPPEDQLLRIGRAPAVFHFLPASRGLTQPPNNQGPNADTLYDCPDQAAAQFDAMPCVEVPGEFAYYSAAPRSRHPGGVNAAYADSRVTFIEDSIDEVLMSQLVSINDGKPAGDAK